MSTDQNVYEDVKTTSEVLDASSEVQDKLSAFYETANDAKSKLIEIINGINNEAFRGLKIDDDFIGIMFVNKDNKLCDITFSKVDETEFQKILDDVKSKQE